MHSPSRVQIPPSPLPAPGFRWNPGASSLSVPGADLCAWVLGAGICVPGFLARAGVSCGTRRAGGSGQVLWVVAEQCRT